jgi:hypothetical protein
MVKIHTKLVQLAVVVALAELQQHTYYCYNIKQQIKKGYSFE